MTRVVRIGKLKIGGKNPVRIKGMIKSSYANPSKVIKEARDLEAVGAQAIRLAIRERKDVKVAKLLKKHIDLPLVADIHFDHSLALLAIDAGFEGIRLNPLNITKQAQVQEVARACKKNKVSIRVGVNSGGFRQKFRSNTEAASLMVKAAGKYISWLEKKSFFDIMVSLKGADVCSTIAANKQFASKYKYPLHLGVTATGSQIQAVVRSAIGIGSLLASNIGDVIRVSLTDSSQEEVRVAKLILEALDLGKFGPQVISCPTCSRCEVNLIKAVNDFKKRLADSRITKPVRIAIMGCVVNGPGEASQADIGVAFGAKQAVIFKDNKIIKKTNAKCMVNDLIKEITNM